jgi:hypothetical protein
MDEARCRVFQEKEGKAAANGDSIMNIPAASVLLERPANRIRVWRRRPLSFPTFSTTIPVYLNSEIPTKPQEEEKPRQIEIPWDDWLYPRYPHDFIVHYPRRRQRKPEDFKEQIRAILDFYRDPRRQRKSLNSRGGPQRNFGEAAPGLRSRSCYRLEAANYPAPISLTNKDLAQ